MAVVSEDKCLLYLDPVDKDSEVSSTSTYLTRNLFVKLYIGSLDELADSKDSARGVKVIC